MKCFFRLLGTMIFVLGLCSEANAARVLLLGDNGSETVVNQALVDAGHDVTNFGLYTGWDGSNPDPGDFGVIIYLNGVDYNPTLQASAATALSEFVAGGCGLVLTEWTAWEVYANEEDPVIDTLMPVFTPDRAYSYGDTWTVQDSGHPLTQGVPGSWNEPEAGWSNVTAKAGTNVVITGTDDNPLLAYSNENGGTVVYINNDMAYDGHTISDNALQLIVNAADYANCENTASIPNLSEWGMIVLSFLLGCLAIWYIRKQSYIGQMA